MSAATPDINAMIDAVVTRKVPAPVLFGGIAAIAIGLVSFVAGLVISPAWAWGALLVGIVYCLGIGQGGVMFSIVSTLTWARWSRPFKRIAETFGLFLPIVWLALIFFLVFGNKVYPWNPATIVEGGPVSLTPHSASVMFAAKPFWLNQWFFVARQIIGVGFMVALDLAYLRASLRPDLIMAKQRLGDKAPGWWNMIIANPKDLATEREKSDNFQSSFGPVIAVAYALVMSLVGFDMIMSLDPWWVSNLFGAWFAHSSYWLSMQAIGVVSMFGLDWLGLRGWIKPKHTHDLGKLILAFTMAWAYSLFSQLLPIWYTNMPEETSFVMLRTNHSDWAWLARIVAVMCFIMPFTVLLSRGIKKMRYPFAALLMCMMTGVFLERTLLILPSVYKQAPDFLHMAISFGVWIGFLGAFVTFVTQVLARMPSLVISDPKLGEHEWDVHVHSLDAAHGH